MTINEKPETEQELAQPYVDDHAGKTLLQKLSQVQSPIPDDKLSCDNDSATPDTLHKLVLLMVDNLHQDLRWFDCSTIFAQFRYCAQLFAIIDNHERENP
jgi:hypothetical protein